MAGAGWYMGHRMEGGIGNHDYISDVGGFVLGVINAQGQNVVGHSRSKLRIQNSHRLSQPRNKKPRVWESFERHREWQNREQEAITDEPTNLPQIFNDFIGIANRAVEGNRWWRAAEGGERKEGQSNWGTKPGSRSSRSR